MTGIAPTAGTTSDANALKGRWFLMGTVVILILAGAVYSYGEKNAWEFSWDALLGRPAAVVNGEPVARSALRERMNISRRMVEREYGKDLFTGERGRALLAELERDVLEKMVEERLVAQEARRLNITVSDELVDQEMRKIGREIYGTWEKFQASLREDGISPEYLAAHVRNLLLFREVNKAKTPPGGNPDRVRCPVARPGEAECQSHREWTRRSGAGRFPGSGIMLRFERGRMRRLRRQPDFRGAGDSRAEREGERRGARRVS